ncbi:MAG TPA: dihydrofolate reductase family protein [Bacillota bacterium]|nr:dihydrofolate reductase family protein [Bacillota bacterium]
MSTRKRPITTLFLLMSLDGKISTGDTDAMDTCWDFPRIQGVQDGLQQYYDIEQQTDLYSLNSARVLVKSNNGVNINEVDGQEKTVVSFIVIDNKPHLNSRGVQNLIQKSKEFFLVTTHSNHPAFQFSDEKNLHILYYKDEIDFANLFRRLKEDYQVERMTIQTGGSLNAVFLRKGLIDKVSIVVAPTLIGGKDTSTLIDGESLHTFGDLQHVKALKLTDVIQLKDSYVQLKYDIINDTKIV